MDNPELDLLALGGALTLCAEDQAENGFHTQNTSMHDWQRRNVIERKGAMDVRCALKGVVHGVLGDMDDDDDDPAAYATLMVFEFRFDSQRQSRRIIRSRISIEFSGMPVQQRRRPTSRPEVRAIAPRNKWSIETKTDDIETTREVAGNLGAAGVPILNVGMEGKWSRTTRRDTTNATTVSGSVDLADGINSGKPNCAGWVLLENKERNTGLPEVLRVAILLKRLDTEPFTGMVKISSHADWKTEIEWMFGAFPIDDPVLFNPKLSASKNMKKYEGLPLGSVALDELADVTWRTDKQGAVKVA
jgi:hypothetical protein